MRVRVPPLALDFWIGFWSLAFAADRQSIEPCTLAEEGHFELVTKTSNGRVASVAIPGFSIDIAGVFADA